MSTELGTFEWWISGLMLFNQAFCRIIRLVDNGTELKTLEWDILNPDLLINLEIKFMRKTSNI